MSSRVYLVTGCTSGFGTTFVETIIKRGDKAIATGRDVSRLAHLETLGAAVLELDVTWPTEMIQETIGKALEIYGHVDILINNAGYVVMQPMEEVSPETLASQFKTNVFGQHMVTRTLLPHMRARIAQAYADEVRPLGIKTLMIEPGFFRTLVLGYTAKEPDIKARPNAIEEYTETFAQMSTFMSQMNGKQPGDPQKAVNVTLDLATGTGVAEGREVPERFPIGEDTIGPIRARWQGMDDTLTKWNDVICSTDF
ncbi:hypothetical protein MMC25_004543 [Agyrium rufum]|nr:hypothetical protein [Agyrium rufum]